VTVPRRRRLPWLLLVVVTTGALTATYFLALQTPVVQRLPETVQLLLFLVFVSGAGRESGPAVVLVALAALALPFAVWWATGGRRHPFVKHVFRTERFHDRAVDALDAEIDHVLKHSGPMDAAWEARIRAARERMAAAARQMLNPGPPPPYAQSADVELRRVGAMIVARLRLIDDAIARRDPALLQAYKDAAPVPPDYDRLNAAVDPLR